MKILYAIQGTGNGHIARACEVAPVLEKKADVDYLVSGCQLDLPLPFQTTYRSKGMSLIFGKKGGVDLGRTIRQVSGIRIHREIRDLPVEKYDLVINDFEPISAWAARRKGVKCVALSHQSALLSESTPKPDRKDPVGHTILRHYAPANCHYGFHFDKYDHGIFTPIIRKEIRRAEVSNAGHYTVYLPAYDDKTIYQTLAEIKDVEWQVFTKHGKSSYSYQNVKIQPIHSNKFVRSMVSSAGVLCGAGFETPSEALYLGKKLMVIPMKNQYEQQCNALALQKMGIAVLRSLNGNVNEIKSWVSGSKVIKKNYPDETESIVDLLLSREI